MISETLAAYAALLLAQMQHDAAVLSTPWVYCTVVPFCLYAIYMGVKWYLLLAPITIPLTTLMVFRGTEPSKAAKLWKN